MTPLVPLGDLIDIFSGFAFKSDLFSNEGKLPLIRIRDVKRGFSETFYSGAYEDRYIVNDGDLLVGMDGEFNRERWAGGRALLNQRVCKITCDSSTLDTNYFYHYLPQALRSIEEKTPFATVKHLSAKDIKESSIPLPPLPEQRRIAAILEKADALRRRRKRAIELLDSLTQSIFLAIVDVSQTVSRPISSFARVLGGKRLPKGHDYVQEETGFKYLRVTDLQRSDLKRSDLKNLSPETQKSIRRYIVNEGDVVISIAGTIGLTRSIDAAMNGVNLTENAAKIVLSDTTTVDPVFLAFALSTPQCQEAIRSSTGQVTIGKLALFRIENLEVPLPPLQVQLRFRSLVSGLENERAKHELAISQADSLFSSLQQRAFSGQL